MPSPFRPPRPERLAWSRRRRVGMRLAAGLTPAWAALAETIPEAEVAALIAEPGFAELVAAFRDLGTLPREERVARLGRLAWNVLERALLDDDLRVAMFVAAEVRRGRDPGETVARGIVNACERAAIAAPVSAAPPPPGRDRQRDRPEHRDRTTPPPTRPPAVRPTPAPWSRPSTRSWRPPRLTKPRPRRRGRRPRQGRRPRPPRPGSPASPAAPRR